MEFVWAEDGPLFYAWADELKFSNDEDVFEYELPDGQLGKPPPTNLRTFAIIFRGATSK